MLRCCFGGSPTRADRTASGNCNISAAAGGAIVVDAEDGSYTLKIAGYSRTKQLLETGKYAISTPFRVGGHVWAVDYCPNGHKDADFVAIYLLLHSAGAKDVKAKFTFSVLDKAGAPVPSFTRTSSSVRIFAGKGDKWGFRKFINKADLEGSPHLTDDCLTIRCGVTVLNEIRCEETRCKQFVVVPPSDLRRQLGGLLESMDGADVTFHVGGDKFLAHRSVLAARSSVFKAELFGSMMENAGGDPVEINDIESDVFRSLLHFIYKDSLPETMDREDVVVMAGHLLVAADRYDVERLKLICEDTLCKYIDPDTVATSLALAEQHTCPGLKEACFEFLASPSNLEAMVASDGYKHLKSSCPSVLKELIARFLPAKLKAAKDIIMTI